MPIYDYQCSSCHRRFELRQGFDAEAVQQCPSCDGTATRRFHPVSVIYKGSGFYTTDYKRGSTSPSPSGEDHEEPVSSDTSESSKVEKPGTGSSDTSESSKVEKPITGSGDVSAGGKAEEPVTS